MNVIECTDKKLALNLNPNQLFVMINDKMRPYLDEIRQLESEYEDIHFVFIDFEASKEMQFKVSEKIDPMLYYAFMHADLVARLMPIQWLRNNDYRYLLHTFTSTPQPHIQQAVKKMIRDMRYYKREGVSHVLRRFVYYGNAEFDAFLIDAFKGDFTPLLRLPQRFNLPRISSKDWRKVALFSDAFIKKLSLEQQEEFWSIVQETIGYNDEVESKLVLQSFLHYKFTEEGGYYDFYPNHDSGSINEPDFKIVIAPSTHRRESKSNYDIMIVKDNQETGEFVLDFDNEKGAKMIFLLTLLLQKVDEGFSLTLFDNEKTSGLIMKLFDMVYEVGGKEWVDKIKMNKHRASTARTHASMFIKNNERIDEFIKYWCAIENHKIEIGTRWNYKLEDIKRIRLPQDRIDVQSDELMDLIKRFPSLEEVNKSPFKESQKDDILKDFREKMQKNAGSEAVFYED